MACQQWALEHPAEFPSVSLEHWSEVATPTLERSRRVGTGGEQALRKMPR